MGSISESSASLPRPQLSKIASGINLLLPLSKRGSGPGLIVLLHEDPSSGSKRFDTTTIIDGIPSPAMKWAEESYTVVEIRNEALATDLDAVKNAFSIAIDALAACDACEPKNSVGLVAYNPSLWNKVAPILSSQPKIVVAAIYADAPGLSELAPSSIPIVQHLAGEVLQTVKLQRTKNLTQYCYPAMKSFAFASPSTSSKSSAPNGPFNYATEAVSHTRNLRFLKKVMDGPFFDLEALWDEHTYFEFETRDTQKTMETMVQEPYVNNVPTITGGIGRAYLTDFYQHHFIFQNPQDADIELISRTVGIDRVIDEFIFKFTHDKAIDWMLPGIPPTFRRVEVPFTAIVNVRGDRLFHEHIHWDQATTLKQLGLLPDYLPWPADLKIPGQNDTHLGSKKMEYQVPAAGIETALKMRDKNSMESNKMFTFKLREVN